MMLARVAARCALSLGLGVMAGSSVLATRLPAQPSGDSAVARAVATLREGDQIRVALLRSRFAGAFMGSRGDTLFFGRAGDPPMGFRFNAVDTLWRAGRATRKGAKVGAVTGGVVGGVFMSRSAESALAGALGGAATGALLGAGIGAVSRHWHRIHP
jgi:hypothetical protein